MVVEAGFFQRFPAEADAVVRNGQGQHFFCRRDRNVYRVGLGMAHDIRERFLDEAVAQEGNGPGKAGKVALRRKSDLDMGLRAAERIDVFFDGV